MKNHLFVVVLIVLSFTIYGQEKTLNNEQKGYIAKGYDLVSYFEKKPEKGKSKYKTEYQGVHLMFSSQVHMELFNSDPKKYFPQYGGWCAYAVAVSGEKVSINPKTYEIRNAKLYLFYNRYFENTYTKWLKEDPKKLIMQADNHWVEIKKGL
ncbi:MAG: hypothetical protein COB98_10900 [Flavobacteriaceae bacterium]|nr:MAG: hypothetical protein COB98_10900 [Flavobacteriaceae bacterium]